MADPLSDARLRHQRVAEQLEEIRATIDGMDRAHRQRTEIEGGSWTTWTRPSPDVLASLSVRVGEMVYNLRAALDYVVYELARLDSGTEQHQTQFPIADSPEDFAKQRAYRLRGVSEDHVREIEALQPYNGNEWIHVLRELSNPDKHRRLVAVVGRHRPRFEDFFENLFRVVPAGTPENPAESDLLVINMSEIDAELQIAFEDGRLVLYWLDLIHRQVGEVIESFAEDFTSALGEDQSASGNG